MHLEKGRENDELDLHFTVGEGFLDLDLEWSGLDWVRFVEIG